VPYIPDSTVHSKLAVCRLAGSEQENSAPRRGGALSNSRAEALLDYLLGILAVIRLRSRRISLSLASSTGSTTLMAACTAMSRSPGML
jgi:hypothetical protein